MADDPAIVYRDRAAGRLETEQIYGDRGVRLLYSTALGRALARLALLTSNDAAQAPAPNGSRCLFDDAAPCSASQHTPPPSTACAP